MSIDPRPLRGSQHSSCYDLPRRCSTFPPTICALGVLTPIFEGILAALAIAALAAGLLINASAPFESSTIPVSMEYEAN